MPFIMPILSFFLSPLGRYVAIALAAVALLGGTYIRGDLHGRAVVHAEWDAANAESIKQGLAARDQAEQEILASRPIDPSGTPSILGRFWTGGVRDDRFNDDRGTVRPVASNPVSCPDRRPANCPASPRPQQNRADPALLGVSCPQVVWASKNLSQQTLDDIRKTLTPAQIKAGKRCLAADAKAAKKIKS